MRVWAPDRGFGVTLPKLNRRVTATGRGSKYPLMV